MGLPFPMPQGQIFSSASLGLLERARACFGFSMRVLDRGLQPLLEIGAMSRAPAFADCPDAARELALALEEGRPRSFECAGHRHRAFLVENVHRPERAGVVVVVTHPDGSAGDLTRSSDLVQAILDADSSVQGALEKERETGRRLVGALRFIHHLSDCQSASEVAQALVQASAIWFDADARVYCRTFDSHYVLEHCLPSVAASARAERLSERDLAAEGEFVPGDWTGNSPLGSATNTLTLRLRGQSDDADWLMRVSGTLPPGAELTLKTMAKVAGLHLEQIETRRAQTLRSRFEQVLSEGSMPERSADLLLRDLLLAVGGAGGALTLHGSQGSRRLAALGAPGQAGSGVAQRVVFGPTEISYPFVIGTCATATLELQAPPGVPFGRDAMLAFRACVPVLRTWLVAAAPALVRSDLFAAPAPTSGFEQRIAEELARAKRFDLGLALVLVDVGDAARAAHVESALRGELRNSDILGLLSDRQVVALLTHTDAGALERVVHRLRVWLAAAAGKLNVPELKFGKAAFSPNCRTPEALLAEATALAEPITRH